MLNATRRRLAQEAGTWRHQGLIDDSLAARYPTGRGDWAKRGRWLLILGTVSLTGGATILLDDWLALFTLEWLAALLVVVLTACFGLAQSPRLHPYTWTRRSLEQVGGLTLISLTFTLALVYGADSGNWPALLLIDLLILLPLAYLLRNLLQLVLSMVVFFASMLVEAPFPGGLSCFDYCPSVQTQSEKGASDAILYTKPSVLRGDGSARPLGVPMRARPRGRGIAAQELQDRACAAGWLGNSSGEASRPARVIVVG